MMFNFWRKNEDKKEVKKPIQTRRFQGAANSLNNAFTVSYNKINADLKNDYIGLTLRARDLAKNNEIVASYISLMLRSVLGNTGFHLNSTIYNEDGSADSIANGVI